MLSFYLIVSAAVLVAVAWCHEATVAPQCGPGSYNSFILQDVVRSYEKERVAV